MKYEGYKKFKLESIPFYAEGWDLLEVIYSEEGRSDSRYLYAAENEYSAMSSTVTVPVKKVEFLFGLKEEGVIQELQEDLQEVRKSNKEARELKEKIEKEKVLLEKQLNLTSDSIRILTENYKSSNEAFDKLKEKTRLMESDLAKVRTALGEIKFKEIVGV